MIYLFGGFGIVILLLGLAVGFEHERAVAANNRADKAELAVRAAQDQATAIAALWRADAARQQAEDLKAKEQANAQIDALKARIAKLPARVVVFDTATVGLFTDIAATANAAGPSPVDKSTPDPVPPPATPEALYDEGDLTAWIAESGRAYRDARAKWQSCVNFYSDLKGKQ